MMKIRRLLLVSTILASLAGCACLDPSDSDLLSEGAEMTKTPESPASGLE
jgi:hypothetical protein